MHLYYNLTKTDIRGIAHTRTSTLQKIDISDGIYVLNIDGYIGTSVRKKIDYAQMHGKEVIYHYK